jgi:hypothetical protein
MAQWTEAEARKAITAAKSAKESSDAVFREAMELTFPDRENFTKRAEGQQKAAYNWDSASTVSVIRAANRLSSDFTPQFQDWLEIGLGAAATQMPDEAFKQALGGKTKEIVKAELEAVTAVVQAVFNGPGFPTASNELYIDWHFGQGGMSIMPSEGNGEPVVFASMPLSHFYAYEGPNGRLDRWFFWHEKRADAILQEWKDAKLPDQLAEMAGKVDSKPVDLCAVVYCDYSQADNAKFRYEVFWQKGSACHRIVSRTSATSPFVTPRYSKLPGENRGRGPILFALPDIRTANKIIELTLRAVSVAVAGVYTSTENGVTGPIRIAPFSIIQVRSNGGPMGPSLQRLDNPQRIDFGELVLEKLHENIKKIIGDNSLPSEAGPIRTATEFVQRARELISDQAGGLGRLRAEFIIPAVQRVIDILERKQILPTQGLQVDQFLIEARMISPLAKGEAMAEVESIIRFIEMMKLILGDQGVALQMNLQRTFTYIADLMSIPMATRNTENERKKIEKGIAQAAAAEAGADPAAAGAAYDQEAAAQEQGAPA